jgi:hypothetical protein
MDSIPAIVRPVGSFLFQQHGELVCQQRADRLGNWLVECDGGSGHTGLLGMLDWEVWFPIVLAMVAGAWAGRRINPADIPHARRW